MGSVCVFQASKTPGKCTARCVYLQDFCLVSLVWSNSIFVFICPQSWAFAQALPLPLLGPEIIKGPGALTFYKQLQLRATEGHF